MPATIHPFPTSLAKAAQIRVLAGVLGKAVTTISPDRDLTVPALCSIILDIATNGSDLDFARRAACTLRIIAALLDEPPG